MNLYIDPGTGSMLFTILIGLLGVLRYMFRSWFVKLRFFFSGGRKGEINSDRLPLVIFSDDKRYWSIFEPVCQELAARNFPVAYMTASEDDPALEAELANFKAEFIGSDNRAFAKLNFLNADIVLSTTPGLDVYQWKRSPEVGCYVHLPHAAGDITLYRMFGIDYYDVMLLSGEYQVKQIRDLEQLRNLPAKECVKVGIPYMDVNLRRVEAAKKIPAQQRTVLLAPSWGPSAILSKFGAKIIDSLLATGYKIIIRPHPQSFKSEAELMHKLQVAYPNSEQLEWNRDNDNFEVLNRSDILISDFSSVMFDFALIFDKPIIYTDTDFDDGIYDAWWLEETPWTFRILPRLGMNLRADNLEQVKQLIDTCLEDEKYSAGRDQARSECWEHRGEGAKRVADYLVAKYKQLQEVKLGEE